MTKKDPTGEIDTGMRMPPNSWHRFTMTHVSTDDCEKIHWKMTAPCPKLNQYVYPQECESCPHGKKGDYKEKWTLCNFNAHLVLQKKYRLK